MTTDPPNRVVLYSYASGEPKPAAEFRLTGGEVILTVLDADWSRPANEYYTRGVPDRAAGPDAVVTRHEPHAFMRALLRPRSATYYEFVDESRTDISVEEQL